MIFSKIEELRRLGFNQSEIAEMHGVSRQAVSWQKKEYGGILTPRQTVNKVWPWRTTKTHGKSKTYQRLRDHGEFQATAGRGMSADKMNRLRSWWRELRDESVVVEFDPEIPPRPGMGGGGFAYRPRAASDENLLIRVNEHTTLTESGRQIWCWPSNIDALLLN